MKLILTAIVALSLTGCAEYARKQQIHQARMKSDPAYALKYLQQEQAIYDAANQIHRGLNPPHIRCHTNGGNGSYNTTCRPAGHWR